MGVCNRHKNKEYKQKSCDFAVNETGIYCIQYVSMMGNQ